MALVMTLLLLKIFTSSHTTFAPVGWFVGILLFIRMIAVVIKTQRH